MANTEKLPENRRFNKKVVKNFCNRWSLKVTNDGQIAVWSWTKLTKFQVFQSCWHSHLYLVRGAVQLRAEVYDHCCLLNTPVAQYQQGFYATDDNTHAQEGSDMGLQLPVHIHTHLFQWDAYGTCELSMQYYPITDSHSSWQIGNTSGLRKDSLYSYTGDVIMSGSTCWRNVSLALPLFWVVWLTLTCMLTVKSISCHR